MPAKRRVLIVVLIVVVAGLLAWHFLGLSRITDPTRLFLSGTVDARTLQIASEAGGRVVALTVLEGSAVVTGDVLVHLDSGAPEARLAQAEAGRAAAAHTADQANAATSVQMGVLAAEVTRMQYAVATADAHLAQLLAGTRPEGIAEAEAAVRQAEAQAEAARAKHAALESGSRPQEVEAARAALERAAAAVAAAQAGVDELRSGTRTQDIERAQSAVEKARASSEKANADLERMKALHAEGAIATDQLERAQTAATVAGEDLATAEAMLDLAHEGPRPETIRMAEAQLAGAHAAEAQAAEAFALVQAGPRGEEVRGAGAQVEQADQLVEAARQRLAALRAGATPETIAVARRQVAEAHAALAVALQRAREAEVTARRADAAAADEDRAGAAVSEAETALGFYTIEAPVEGIVDSINVKPGEVAAPGASLLTLVNPADLWVQVYVPEPQLARVMLGQRAEISVDGYDEPVTATLYWIAEKAEFTPKYIQTKSERARLVYAVRVRPDDPGGILKPGMPADVTIFTD